MMRMMIRAQENGVILAVEETAAVEEVSCAAEVVDGEQQLVGVRLVYPCRLLSSLSPLSYLLYASLLSKYFGLRSCFPCLLSAFNYLSKF